MNTRLCPTKYSRKIRRSPRAVDFHDDDSVIEKENKKMLERKQNQRPKRLLLKKDTSLSNPTPQMLEIMAKIREKSISPPLCTKKHRHNRYLIELIACIKKNFSVLVIKLN